MHSKDIGIAGSGLHPRGGGVVSPMCVKLPATSTTTSMHTSILGSPVESDTQIFYQIRVSCEFE